MSLFLLPLLAGSVPGLFAGYVKNMLPLGLVIAIAGFAWWTTTVIPPADLMAAVKSSGAKTVLQSLFKHSPHVFYYAPMGLAGGFIIGKILYALTAGEKHETPKQRKKRILAVHGMKEFD